MNKIQEQELRNYILEEWVDSGFIKVLQWRNFTDYLQIWKNKEVEKALKLKDEELKEKIDEFKKKIKINGNLAYRIIETEEGDFKSIRDDALKIIVLEVFTEIFSEEKA